MTARPDDDDLLEAAAIAEEDPAEVTSAESSAGGQSERDEQLLAEAVAAAEAGEEVFVDGTPGRSDLAAERDEYREAFMRIKADFENYKKRADKQNAERVDRVTEALVAQLLPVLDACDAALEHGASEVEPIHKSLVDVLEREGLERLDPVGDPFDPALHEAVMHEEGDEGEPTVVGTLRIGYQWKGRVIRPAMVKVRG